ncbi:MAG TPA: FtsW/RodA/SpoVE family cell cycle protein, partial [Clostridia bacterium]
GLLILMILILVVVIAFAFIVMPLMPADYLDQYDYWGRRINIFTNSEDASQDDLHQSEQSKIAIGSGGLTGVGLGQGRQKFNYLPEEFNDYVFAILAEELGLAGSMSVILLFTALLLMGTAAAMKTSGPFPTIIIFGYTSLIAMQAFLNIGVAAGVLPPTGISLPLFSYGGTSNLFFLLGIGLLLGASRSGGAHPQTRRPSHA